MKIPLNSFEQLIDETILKRGLEYGSFYRTLQIGQVNKPSKSIVLER